MGFTVVHGSPQTIWSPIVDSDTVYVGSLVTVSDEGCKPLPIAAGAADTTNKSVIFGVCIGTNNRTPVFSSTYNAEYITDATPKDATTEFVGMEGPWTKGTYQAMAKIAVITPNTVVRGPIFQNAVGTAMNVVTVSAAGANAKSCTTDTTGFCRAGDGSEVIKTNNTIYFRSGTNMGEYRVTDSSSSLYHTWDKALRAAPAVGDTAVIANGLRPCGYSRFQILAEATCINNYADSSTNNYAVNVVRLDLATAGQEYAEFMFLAEHFSPKRA